MNSSFFSFALLVGSALTPAQTPRETQGYWSALTGATRELSNQLNYLQRTIATIPGPSEGRGFYQSIDGVQADLIYFQQQLRRKTSRESLYIAFDKMDAKLHRLMSDLKNFEKWSQALALVAERVQSADHDLHFALSIGDNSPSRKTQTIYRQTLVLLAKTQNLTVIVRYQFANQERLQLWTPDLKAFQESVDQFQKLQQNKASPQQLKTQFLKTDAVWQKLINRFKGLAKGQHILLQNDMAEVDQVFVRLAPMFGIKNRRAQISDPFAL